MVAFFLIPASFWHRNKLQISFPVYQQRVLPTDDEAEDEIQEDLREATEEKNLEDLSKQVLNEVSIQHPIMYDTYNICDCVSQSKLDKFSISVLQDICGSFQLNTSDIGQRRKKPYIELIESLVENVVVSSVTVILHYASKIF